MVLIRQTIKFKRVCGYGAAILGWFTNLKRTENLCLMASVKKSLVFSFIQNYGVTALHFISSVIIARLLTPEEVGVFSVGIALVAIAHAVRDFGVSNYIVQEKEFTESKKNASVQIAFIVSWTLALLILASSFLAGNFYNDPRVSKVLSFLSINFFLLPFSSVGLAILRRRMQFDLLCYIHLVSGVAQVSFSIALAYLGYSYMSLVWGSIAGILTTVIFAICFVPLSKASFVKSDQLGWVARKGVSLSFASILYEFGNNYSEMVVGKTLGFAMVGYFGKAVGVLQLVDRVILGAVRPVLLPSYSEKYRLDLLNDKVILNYLDMVLVVCWPLLLWLSFNAEHIIYILFGKQWLFAASLVPVLCLMAAFKYIGSVVGPVITATGHINYLVKYQSVIVLVKVIAVSLSALVSIIAVCWSLVISEIVSVVILFWYVKRCMQFSVVQILYLLFKNMIIILFLGAGLFVVSLANWVMWEELLVTLLLIGILWCCCIFSINHPIRAELVNILMNTRTKIKVKL